MSDLHQDDRRPLADRLLDLELGELDEAEREALDRELEASPELQARQRTEVALHSALSQRLSRVPAPPGLETRIRAALDQAAAPPIPVAWYRRPLFGALAAAVVIVAVALPFVTQQSAVPLQRFQAMVVDHDCDKMGQSLGAQRLCTAPSHRNVVKTDEGDYLLVADELYPTIASTEMRGHHVGVGARRVDGRLQIEELVDLGLSEEVAMIREDPFLLARALR